MSNLIPTAKRQQVRERAKGMCERCSGPGYHWHHRRRRAIKDDHTHCSCNGVLLCGTCHEWAHAHPQIARQQGWIVIASALQPGAAAVETIWGRRVLTCDGRYEEEKA